MKSVKMIFGDKRDKFVDDEILDSFAIISLVAALEEEYDITISPAELVPENFKTFY